MVIGVPFGKARAKYNEKAIKAAQQLDNIEPTIRYQSLLG